MPHNDPTPLRLAANGRYSSPEVLSARVQFRPGDVLPARILLDLAPGSTLEIPLTPQALANLARELAPKVPPLV